MKRKPILCLDFDGVIHSYVSGWKGARTIPDAPVPGALQFMCDALDDGWDVVIHSSRSRYIGGIWAMRQWLKKHAEAAGLWDQEKHSFMLPCLLDVRFARFKPPAMWTIDDRALTFTGTWPELGALKKRRPWNLRDTGASQAGTFLAGLAEVRKQSK